FLGYVSNIQDVLSHSSLYLHTSRGDAFPTSTIEAAQAGLPVLVSDVTGTKEIFQKISPELIVPLDEDKIAERISWYFSLSIEERQKLSAKCKEVAIKYTEDNAITRYKEVFQEIFTS
ncbi:MAG: glycosyltransferase, partial [Flammeovirgaceae bacterium]|nr:glycosyltransferase [Flammeovirgaceae bacterium]MDW8287873.1 glycosyltransferase [Flammeovirgaceae bacterium]